MSKNTQSGPSSEPTKKANQTVPLSVMIDYVVARTNVSRDEVTKIIYAILEKGEEHHGKVN